MSDEPSADEKRQAASKRAANSSPAEYGTTATSYFHNSRGPAGTRSARNHTLPAVWVTEDFAVRVASYGNTNNLNLSDSVRNLIEAGLEHWEDPK